MDINSLNSIIEKKISQNISCKKITIDDKTYLHKNHKSHEKNKFHIKLIIKSDELLKKKLKKIFLLRILKSKISLFFTKNIKTIKRENFI